MEEKLTDIQQNLKKRNTYGLITAASCVGMFICILILTLKIIGIMPEVQTLIQNANGVITEIETATAGLSSTAESLKLIADSIEKEGLAKMYEALDSLNSIDMDSLNESINALSEVVKTLESVLKPLAGLFGGR